MIKKFTIYGERCSGTNYLQNIIEINFEIIFILDHGRKHFFGFNDHLLKNSDDTLFLCIIRDPVDWIISFYRKKYHLPLKYKYNLNEQENLDEFLNKEFWSFYDKNKNRDISKEIMEDRNIYTGERYKNIFEMRHTKIRWMIEDLPKKVKNCIILKYEDLINDFENTVKKIRDIGLKVRDNINFPLNSSDYKNIRGWPYIKKINDIEPKIILDNQNLIKFYEEKLGYITN
jgi:hypothetical protein